MQVTAGILNRWSAIETGTKRHWKVSPHHWEWRTVMDPQMEGKKCGAYSSYSTTAVLVLCSPVLVLVMATLIKINEITKIYLDFAKKIKSTYL